MTAAGITGGCSPNVCHHVVSSVAAAGWLVLAEGPECVSTCYAETGSQRRSYRSIKDAVEAAQSGDQIILQPGVHNGLG